MPERLSAPHPCPARLNWKCSEYVFLPQNRVDVGNLDLDPRYLLGCVAFAEARLRVAQFFRQHRAMHRAAFRQRGSAFECGNAPLAEKYLLDVARHELRSLDDRPV